MPMSSRPAAPIVRVEPALAPGRPTGAARPKLPAAALGSSVTTPNRYPVISRNGARDTAPPDERIVGLAGTGHVAGTAAWQLILYGADNPAQPGRPG